MYRWDLLQNLRRFCSSLLKREIWKGNGKMLSAPNVRQSPLANSSRFFEPFRPLHPSASLFIIHFLNATSPSHRRKQNHWFFQSLSSPLESCHRIMCTILVPRTSTNTYKQVNKERETRLKPTNYSQGTNRDPLCGINHLPCKKTGNITTVIIAI